MKMDVKLKKTTVMIEDIVLKLLFMVDKVLLDGIDDLSNVLLNLVDFLFEKYNGTVIEKGETIEGKIFIVIEFVFMVEVFKCNNIGYLLHNIFFDIGAFTNTLAQIFPFVPLDSYIV